MDAPGDTTLSEALSHERFVRSAARAVLGVDDRVEDVVQESLVAALRTGPRAVGALRAWLGTVARRRSIDLRRRDAARRRAEVASPLRPSAPPPDEILAHEEVRRVLVEELLALDGPSREVLLLRFYEDLPLREIATRLGVPVETVRTRTRRAIDRLRGRLDARLPARRAWALALGAVAGLRIVPAGAATISGGAVWAAAGLLAAAVGGSVWLVAGSGDEGAPSSSPAETAAADGLLAAPPARVTARAPVRAGEACGVVGYVTAGAGPARASVALRRVADETYGVRLATARPTEAPPDVSVDTDARGRFVADGLAIGRYVLTATLPDGHARFTEVSLTDAGALVRVRLDLTRGDRTLRASVLEPGGRPARGWVHVGEEMLHDTRGGAVPVALDEAGAFAVEGLRASIVSVVGSFEGRPGVERTTLEVRAEPAVWALAQPEPARSEAPRRGALEGRVRTADGRAVGGVRVRARVEPVGGDGRLGGRSGETVADAAGLFRIEGLGAGEATVWVLDAGWMSKGLPDVRLGGFNPLAVATDAEGRATVAVEVVPAASVRGRVVDEDGRGVARVVAALDPAEDGETAGIPTHPPLGGRGRAVTDADGRFEIVDAVPGRRYEVRASGGDVVGSSAPPLSAPAEIEVLAATLDPAAWVEVLVVDADTNAPLPGAGVGLRRPHAGGSAGVGSRVRTGADGLARVGPLPRGRVAVDVDHPDQREEPADVEVTAGRARVAVRTGPSIAGVVRYPSGADPWSRTEFDVLRPDGNAVAEDREVGEDGSFHSGALPPGRYRLVFRRRFPDPPLSGEVEADAGARDLEVALAPVHPAPSDAGPGPAPWRVAVRASDGRAVARGSLHVLRERNRTSFGFSEGQLDLTITGAPLTAVLQVTDVVGEGGARLPFASVWLPARTYGLEGGTLALVLTPEKPIEGVVVDAEGRPRAGVLVTAEPRQGEGPRLAVVGSARTDAEGRFRLGGTGDGAYLLHADPPPGCVARDVVASGGAVGVRIAFDATLAATLRILDAAGRPLEGADVLVRPAEGREDPFDRDVASRVRSDASGRARVEGLDGSKPWRLAVDPPSGRDDLFPAVVSPWPVADGEVRLERAWALTGRILDLAGQPVAGASVTGGGASVSTEADGRFVLRPLRAGSVRVQTRLDWVHGPSIDAEAGGDAGDLRLDRGVPLRVRIAEWPGLPPRRAWMPVLCKGRRPDGRPFGANHSQTADGTFSMSAVPRDHRYRVYVGPWPDGRYAVGEGLEGRDEPHVLPLRQGLEITGRLLGSAADLEGATVQLRDDTGSFLDPIHVEEGSFRFVGVPPGRYALVASRGFHEVARVEVEAGATNVDVPVTGSR